MIDHLVALLHDAELGLSANDIADALWLALHTTPADPHAASGRRTDEKGAPLPNLRELLQGRRTVGADGVTRTPQQEVDNEADIFPQTSETPGAGDRGRRGVPFRSPAATALPAARAIGGALRPLMRRVPSRTQKMLDVQATVQAIADELIACITGGCKRLRVLEPVLQPAPSRWFELVLVADAGGSMVIWRQMILELKRLLDTHGAFRNVHLWSLLADDGSAHLHVGYDIRAQRQARSADELIDSAGRRIVLVVSDCVAPGWYSGAVAKLLEPLARIEPVTLIQVLPERLWSGTALAQAQRLFLHAASPAAPNSRLTQEPAWGWLDTGWLDDASGAAPRLLPLPVLTLSPESVLAWARMVVAAGDVWISGVGLPTVGTVIPSSDGATDSALGGEERVALFREVASPLAYRLAQLLATVPLTLPVMRLVQTMLPRTRQSHLAEVFLGGLLYKMADADDPDYVYYEFYPGVRERLRAAAPINDAVAVLSYASSFVADRLGQSFDVRALREDPNAVDGVAIDGALRPYAELTVPLLRRVGGRAAESADRLQQRLAQHPVEQTTEAHTISEAAQGRPPQTGPALFTAFAAAPPELAASIVSFRWLVEDRTSNFVGRVYVFEAIDRILGGGRAGYILISGEPGIGKTALAARLVEQHGYVHHFVAAAPHPTPDAFLASICAQLIVKYGLDHTTLPAGTGALSRVLVRLLEQAAAREQNRPVVVIVDGLDEADNSRLPPDVNSLYLPSALPAGVFIIVTTRLASQVRLRTKQRHEIALRSDSPQNMEDLRAYVRAHIAANLQTFIGRLIVAGREHRMERFVNSVVERSRGNFVYLQSILHAISQGALALPRSGTLPRLPANLSAYYRQQLAAKRRAHPERFETVTAPVLRALATADRTWSITELAEQTGLDPKQLLQAIHETSEWIVEEGGHGTPQYSLFHKSLVDFLHTELGATAERAANGRVQRNIAWGLEVTGVAASPFTGKGVRVAILDTGFDLSHPDFVGRTIVTRSFVPGEDVQDGNGHGTHNVGIACGPRRPGQPPRYGIASDAEIYIGKVLSNRGTGADSRLLQGIEWAVANDCAVILLSAGSPTAPGQQYSPIFETAAKNALALGSLIIASAGTDSQRPERISPVAHPANCPSIIAVGTVDPDLAIATDSNGGGESESSQIDIVAPGVNIPSTWPSPALYREFNGSSAAAAHVAGIAALLAEANPNARGVQLAALLRQTARPLPFPAPDVGAGLVQAPQSMTALQEKRDLRLKIRPIMAGTGISLVKGRAGGTLCCIVQDDAGEHYLLSTEQALDGNIGELVIQPARSDGGRSADAIAEITHKMTAQPYDPTNVPSSINYATGVMARLLRGVQASPAVSGAERIRGILTKEESLNLFRQAGGPVPLKIVGSASGLVNGTMTAIRSSLVLRDNGKEFYFEDSFEITGFSARLPGNSGAPVLTQDDKLIGMIFAGDSANPATAFAMPIEPLLQALGVTIAQFATQSQDVLPPSGTNIHPQPLEVPEIARIYNYPTQFGGSGQIIGLLEFGGGYRPADLVAYFAAAHLPMPQVIDVSVDGTANAPGSDADVQVTLDIEIIGALAPKAIIRVYFANFTAQGFVDALSQAVQDHVSIISIGWGTPESGWKGNDVTAINNALQAAAEKGITVIAAVGAGGVTARVEDGKPHVDFPASSPWVLAVGGTSVVASAHQIVEEIVWNDQSSATGGGVSELFEQPDWQAAVQVPVRKDGTAGRGIPDVAAIASPSSGAILLIGGSRMVIGGTSLSAPVWAGLIALINQGLGYNVGYLNPLLYQKVGPAGVLRSITQGNNSMGGVQGYAAGPGWNPVAGWGSPDGTKLLEWLRTRS
jgi:subtilisin family serine protease